MRTEVCLTSNSWAFLTADRNPMKTQPGRLFAQARFQGAPYQ